MLNALRHHGEADEHLLRPRDRDIGEVLNALRHHGEADVPDAAAAAA